jgi:hypothetical protein
MIEFPELGVVDSGDGTDAAMFNIAEQDVFYKLDQNPDWQ